MENVETIVKEWVAPGDKVPKVTWKEGEGVGGGWEMTISGDCSFLSGGEERGWRFSGDEAFAAAPGQPLANDAGSGLGVVVEGRKSSRTLSPSRL